MKLDWLEDFLALSAEANFSRAAEQRHVAQPAFSRRIRMLEDWVGIPLFDRSSQPIQLTDAGRRLLPIVETVTNQLYLGRENIIQAAKGEETLKFAATHTISILFFPAWLHTILGSDTETSLNLESNHMDTCSRLLAQRLCQFMLCYTHPDAELGFDQSLYASRVVAQDELVPVSAPDPLGRPLHPVPGTKEAPARYLYFSKASALGQIIDAMMARRPEAAHVRKYSSSPLAAALKSMAESALGVTWIPGLLARPAITAGTLVEAGDASWSIPIEIRMFRANGPLPEAAQNFWRSILSLTD